MRGKRIVGLLLAGCGLGIVVFLVYSLFFSTPELLSPVKELEFSRTVPQQIAPTGSKK